MYIAKLGSAFLGAIFAAGFPVAAALAIEPNPAVSDPAAPAPAVKYQSAFADYRKPQFEPMLDWRKANEVVGQVGGFAGALKDAPRGSSPEPDPHAGHHK